MLYAFWISAVLWVGGKSSETFHEVVVAMETTPLECSYLFPVVEQQKMLQPKYWKSLKSQAEGGRVLGKFRLSPEGDSENKTN